MKSIIIALVLSLVMVVGASSTALAGPPHPHHPGFGPVAAAVGFTAAVVGAAMAPPVYAAPVYSAPVYAAPVAPVYYAPQPVVVPYAPPRPVYYAPPRPVFYPHRPMFRPRPW